MDILDKVRQWVCTFPLWEAGRLLFIDYMEGVPGAAGLYPGGLEVVSVKTDVLGGVRMRCRYHFALYRAGTAEGDGADARWLEAFQSWVMEQSALGLAPRFGDEPGNERIVAEKAGLKDGSVPGTGIYTVKLTAQFVKYYEKRSETYG